MKKIDLKNYELDVKLPNGESKKIPYNVRESMSGILVHPELKLNGRDLLIAHKLASKIEECKEDEVLLELVEYEKLVRAVETIRGLSKNDVEFCQRILEAPDVEVTEKK